MKLRTKYICACLVNTFACYLWSLKSVDSFFFGLLVLGSSLQIINTQIQWTKPVKKPTISFGTPRWNARGFFKAAAIFGGIGAVFSIFVMLPENIGSELTGSLAFVITFWLAINSWLVSDYLKHKKPNQGMDPTR